jgi:hypothetical protein
MLEVNHFAQDTSVSMATNVVLLTVMVSLFLELMLVPFIKLCGTDIKSLIAAAISLEYGK